MQNGVDHLIGPGALERVAARHSFVADDAQGKNVGGWGQRLQFDLLGGHVEQRSLLRARGVGVGHVSDAEVDDLHRVVFHHEDVARL